MVPIFTDFLLEIHPLQDDLYLHHNRQLHQSAQAVYGLTVETLVEEEDNNPLNEPIIERSQVVNNQVYIDRDHSDKMYVPFENPYFHFLFLMCPFVNQVFKRYALFPRPYS